MTVFALFLTSYLLTLIGNILIVITIIYDSRLHTPMYFFFCNLSFIDVCHSKVTVPKMLRDQWSEEKLIFFEACVTQIFFLQLFACTEIFLLTVISYALYMAFCKPLWNMTVMNWKVCVLLALARWMGSTIHSISLTSLTIKLLHSVPDETDSFFCDVPQVIKLACTDTHIIEILIISNSGLILLVCFMVLVVSHAVILVIQRQQISEGWQKALSTCAALLTIITRFLGHCIFIYSRPSTSLLEDKVVSVFFTTVTPLWNPIIYTLRNEDMKKALNKFMGRLVGRGKK